MDTWEIIRMQRQAEDGLVIKVILRVYRSDNGINIFRDFVVSLDKTEQFIPFENLTKEIVISWLKEKIDPEELDLVLNLEIETQKNKNKNILIGTPW